LYFETSAITNAEAKDKFILKLAYFQLDGALSEEKSLIVERKMIIDDLVNQIRADSAFQAEIEKDIEIIKKNYGNDIDASVISALPLSIVYIDKTEFKIDKICNPTAPVSAYLNKGKLRAEFNETTLFSKGNPDDLITLNCYQTSKESEFVGPPFILYIEKATTGAETLARLKQKLKMMTLRNAERVIPITDEAISKMKVSLKLTPLVGGDKTFPLDSTSSLYATRMLPEDFDPAGDAAELCIQYQFSFGAPTSMKILTA
jgi:hypothetical protein